MSVYLYLQCEDHEPPIRSDDVGQHTRDLKRIRAELADREHLIACEYAMSGLHHFTSSARLFLAGHPKCRISIVDEYGHTYDLTGDSREPIT